MSKFFTPRSKALTAEARAVAKAEAAAEARRMADEMLIGAQAAEAEARAAKELAANSPEGGTGSRAMPNGSDAPTKPLLEGTAKSDAPVGNLKVKFTAEVPVGQQRPFVAAAMITGMSVIMCLVSIIQEKGGFGIAANSDLQPDQPPVNEPNTLWVMLSTALVMIMTPGLSLYYGGMVADEKVLNRMVRTFVNLGLITFQCHSPPTHGRALHY